MLAQRCIGQQYAIMTVQKEVNDEEVTKSLNRHNFVTTTSRTYDSNLTIKTRML